MTNSIAPVPDDDVEIADVIRHGVVTASERSRKNEYSSTHQGILTDPSRIDVEGVAGELAFARAFGFALDEVHAKGPTSCNFMLRDGTRVDVRTSRAAGFLLVPVSKMERSKIDAYVLARYSAKSGVAKLVGWATRADILAAPTSIPTTRNTGIPAYMLSCRSLRLIDDLLARHNGSHRGQLSLLDD